MSDFTANEVVKQFDSAAGSLRILDGVSLMLQLGENVAIVGPSGSGKSTFLHLAGTLDRPTSGSIRLLETDLTELSASQSATFRNQKIGFIFQEHHLLPQLTAIENVLLPTLAVDRPDSRKAERAAELLDKVGLAARRNHLPSAMSGGERQRVAVARALINDPVLLLADEPTGSLDQANADKIGELLLELQQALGNMLICVTHSDRLAAMFQKRLSLQQGKFVDE